MSHRAFLHDGSVHKAIPSLTGTIHLVTGKDVYLAIRLAGEQVLDRYPPKELSQTVLGNYGGGLFQLETSTIKKMPTKRGRPSKRWDEVSMRIAERLTELGALPAKQDAFAQELVDWYFEKFDQKIGLSTVKARLKIYYNNPNFEKSEK